MTVVDPEGATLRALGLSEREADAYHWLVLRGQVRAEDVVARFGPDLAGARSLLEDLEEMGLVTRSAGDADTFVASPPNLALGPRLREQHERLGRAEAALAELVERYQVAAPQRGISDVVDVVPDRRGVAQRFIQLQAGAQDEVLAFVRSGVLAVSGEDNLEEGRALARGVRYRIVVERGVLERPGFVSEAARLGSTGGGARAVLALPGRLLVADRSLAMLPMQPEGSAEVGALLVHASPLLDMLMDLFESYWAVAAPVVPGTAVVSDPALSDTDARMLALFDAGLTDRAVASQLGLSMRTVQRRVRELMDQLGVDTRFRLGVEAERRGWLGRR